MPPTRTYLQFEDVSHLYSGKRKRIEVKSYWGSQLGEIKWYSPWRRYCFWSFEHTILNDEHLETVKKEIQKLAKVHPDD